MAARRQHGEGSIYQRARDGRWVAELDLGYVNGRRMRKLFTGRTRRDVADRLKAAQRDLDDGRTPSMGKERLGVYLDRWLRDVVDPSELSSATKSFYRTHVERHIVPALGDLLLLKVKPEDVHRLITQSRAKGLSDRSVQAVHATLRVAMRQAERWDLIRFDPTSRVSVQAPRRNLDKVHAVPRGTIVKLLEAARKERLGAMIFLLPMLGLRKGELLAMRWSRVDLDAGTLLIDSSVHRVKGVGMEFTSTKTHASVRTVRIPTQCVDLLRQRKRSQASERLVAGPLWTDLDLVFSRPDGHILDSNVPNTVLHRLCDEIGVPRERVHNLRHSAATAAAEVAYGDLGVVKNMLGHSSIAVTVNLYRHFMPEAGARLGDAIGMYYTDEADLAPGRERSVGE